MGLPEATRIIGLMERDTLRDGDVIVFDAVHNCLVTKHPNLRLFADATARAATAPDFAGQTAVQIDTGELFVGSASAWLPYKAVIRVADATARAAAVPAFIGQLALQIDTGALYFGTATTAGSWTLVTATAAA